MATPACTNTMQVSSLIQTRTLQVKSLSDLASDREIHEFFSFSGDIEHIQILRMVAVKLDGQRQLLLHSRTQKHLKLHCYYLITLVDGGLWPSRSRHMLKDAVKQLSRAVEKWSRDSPVGVPTSKL